jgi:hypothetical protein
VDSGPFDLLAEGLADPGAGLDGVTPADPGPDAGLPPGCPGKPLCPCLKPADCESGYCVETMDAPVCAATCAADGDCPDGWTCRVLSTFPQEVKACAAPDRLCRPCKVDAECNAPGASGNFCLEAGPDGRFCGLACKDDSGCPDGYSCASLVGGAQCRPDGGNACPCTAKSKAQGFLTQCYRENTSGRCVADRKCDEPCAAAEPAAELCNGKDDDCDGQTDEDVPAKECDLPSEFGTCKGKSVCVGGQESCTGTPAVAETCNGKDDDCDGLSDEEGAAGCVDYFKDVDGDGYAADGAAMRCLCGPDPATLFTALQPGDCNDADPAVHAGAVETCNGKDDDCDGVKDGPGAAGCAPFFKDGDGDGYGLVGDSKCLCAAAAPYLAATGGDCDDADPAAHPGMAETCNGKDDDCNGVTDDAGASGCVTYFLDQDGDGAGVTGNSKCLCAATAPYTASQGGDCADNDKDVHPGVVEICNGKDDNCDGQTDPEDTPGCKKHYQDADGDGYGDAATFKCLCGPTGLFTSLLAGDCDDANPAANPGKVEDCSTVFDDDCDGDANEPDVANCKTLFLDVDGDGWGTADSQCWCGPRGKYAASKSGDCDDGNAAANPGMSEDCATAFDDDCDGKTNEQDVAGCRTWYRDADGDGWGTADSQCWCEASGEYRATHGTECAEYDQDPDVYPGKGSCGKDVDCDGKLQDAGETCDDGNTVDWDGCRACQIVEFPVSGYSTGSQSAPAVAAFPDGRFVVAWQDGARDGAGAGIYGAVYGSDGAQAGADFQANATTAGNETDPSISPMTDGRFLVSWIQAGKGLVVRRFKADGIPDSVEMSPSAYQGVYAFTGFGDGRFAFAWPQCNDKCICTHITKCIKLVQDCSVGFTECAADGTGCKSGSLSKYQWESGPYLAGVGLAGTPDGRLVVGSSACDDCCNTYTRIDSVPVHSCINVGSMCRSPGISAGRINNAGVLDGSTLVNTYTTGEQASPAVAALGDGSFLVVWRSAAQDGGGMGVFGQWMNADGSKSGAEFQANTFVSGDQAQPAVAIWEDRKAVVVWTSAGQEGVSAGTGIYLQRHGTDGAPDGTEVHVNAYTPGDQSEPAVASFPDGRFIVVWTSKGQDGSDNGIYALRFGPDGKPIYR